MGNSRSRARCIAWQRAMAARGWELHEQTGRPLHECDRIAWAEMENDSELEKQIKDQAGRDFDVRQRLRRLKEQSR
jgi:hypothetical protein